MPRDTLKHRTFRFADMVEEECGKFQNRCRRSRQKPLLVESANGNLTFEGGEFLFGEEPPASTEDAGGSGPARFRSTRICRTGDEWRTAESGGAPHLRQIGVTQTSTVRTW